MKKRLSGCSECGDDTAILTQVSSGPEVILLCTDCYNLKHSNETQNHISHEEDNIVKFTKTIEIRSRFFSL